MNHLIQCNPIYESCIHTIYYTIQSTNKIIVYNPSYMDYLVLLHLRYITQCNLFYTDISL